MLSIELGRINLLNLKNSISYILLSNLVKFAVIILEFNYLFGLDKSIFSK
jgi:hypothetical protein